MKQRVHILVLGALALSCSTIDGSVDVYLVHSMNAAEDPLDPSLVTHIRVRVTGTGMEPEEELFVFEPGGFSTVPRIGVGKNRVITVEGLAAEDGYAVSRGRSLPLTIEEGNEDLELFIARVGRFSLIPDSGLKQARFAHVAMLSKQGKLFFMGGAAKGNFEHPEGLLSSVERYDPTSGGIEFFACGQSKNEMCLARPRAHAVGAEVEDGILLAGGIGTDGLLSSLELVDPDSMRNEELASGGAARSNAVVLDLGQYRMVAGGRDATGLAVDVTELISPEGEVETLSLPTPRWAMAAAPSSSRGFLFGGFDENREVSSDFFIFDSATRKFSVRQTDVEGRAWASAVPLSDGRVLIIGGLNQNGEASGSVDLYDPLLQALCHVGELKQGRWLASAVVLRDGRVMTMGGLVGSTPGEPTARVEMLDPRFLEITGSCDQSSSELPVSFVPDMKVARFSSSAVLLPNGMVAVAGGLSRDGAPVKQVEVFVPDE